MAGYRLQRHIERCRDLRHQQRLAIELLQDLPADRIGQGKEHLVEARLSLFRIKPGVVDDLQRLTDIHHVCLISTYLLIVNKYVD